MGQCESSDLPLESTAANAGGVGNCLKDWNCPVRCFLACVVELTVQ